MTKRRKIYPIRGWSIWQKLVTFLTAAMTVLVFWRLPSFLQMHEDFGMDLCRAPAVLPYLRMPLTLPLGVLLAALLIQRNRSSAPLLAGLWNVGVLILLGTLVFFLGLRH